MSKETPDIYMTPMKHLFALFLLCLIPACLTAQSNAAPSLKVALAPCSLYSGALSANTRADITTAGVCNVPAETTSIDMAVMVTASGIGTLKLWEYDGTEPAASVVSYGSGTTSSFASVRACAPWPECFYGISAKATSGVSLSLVTVAYYIPLVTVRAAISDIAAFWSLVPVSDRECNPWGLERHTNCWKAVRSASMEAASK